MKLDLLTKEQVIGDNKLDIFNKILPCAKVTDYAVSQGIDYSLYNNIKFGIYYTKSISDSYYVYGIGPNIIKMLNPLFSTYGYRLVLNLKDIPSEVLKNIKKTNDGVKYLYFGEYPQSMDITNIDNWDLVNSKMLDEKFTIYPENKKTNMPKLVNYARVFNGDKYISNVYAENNKIYWFKIEPVKWFVDEKSNLIISDKILFSGIPFNLEEFHDNNFENTYIYNYLNKYVVREMFCNETIISNKQKDTNKKIYPDIDKRISEIKTRIKKLQERR